MRIGGDRQPLRGVVAAAAALRFRDRRGRQQRGRRSRRRPRRRGDGRLTWPAPARASAPPRAAAAAPAGGAGSPTGCCASSSASSSTSERIAPPRLVPWSVVSRPRAAISSRSSFGGVLVHHHAGVVVDAVGDRQRQPAAVVAHVQLGAGVHEQRHRLVRAAPGRPVQRGFAVLVDVVDRRRRARAASSPRRPTPRARPGSRPASRRRRRPRPSAASRRRRWR